MTRTALILAAHGSRVEPAAIEPLDALSKRIAGRNLFDEVTAAFHHGRPTFATVLDALTADQVIVVPVMTSAGFYSDVVLPRELARNRRFHEVHLHRTVPIGTHPQMVDLVSTRLQRLAEGYGLDPRRTTVAVVGHGTNRHADSRRATEDLVETLTRRGIWAEILAAFLDENPGVETILPRAKEANVVVIPFLVGGGSHATVDIPTRLGLSPIGTPPFDKRIGERRVICDRAVGADERLLDIVVKLALNGRDAIRTRSASDGPRPRASAWGSDGRALPPHFRTPSASDGPDPALALGVRKSVTEVFR